MALHAAWLIGLWWLGPTHAVDPGWLVVFLALQGARAWVLMTLGRRWTTRIIVLPGAPPIAAGPYRWLAHPNYAVVIGEIAVLPLCLGLPWYAAQRSPFGRPDLVARFVTEPGTVVSYPRNCDSLAFYAGRSDLRSVRTRDVNQLMVDCHHRPRTVVLFTHRDSLAGFRNTLPPERFQFDPSRLPQPGDLAVFARCATGKAVAAASRPACFVIDDEEAQRTNPRPLALKKR